MPPSFRRIILSNPDHPSLLRNHDQSDASNTSLHLAARLGLVEIAEFLLLQGHESQGVSRNMHGESALHVAAQAGSDDDSAVVRGRVQVGKLIVSYSPEAVHVRDKKGLDVFLHASAHGTGALMMHLLTLEPPSMFAQPSSGSGGDSPATIVPADDISITQYYLNDRDAVGNTPLHLAAAQGQLKTVRLLVGLGADEKIVNVAGWRPAAYSASVSAEVYLKGLVREREAQRVLGNIETAGADVGERKRGHVRMVSQDDDG